MTGLKMHWRLIQKSDGRMHLNMQWEAAHSDLVRVFARKQIHARGKIVRAVAKREGCAASSKKRAVSNQPRQRQDERVSDFASGSPSPIPNYTAV